MATFALLVDGERVAKVESQEDVRSWLLKYREEHAEDDPSAAHVQVIERGALWWVTGGKLVDRLRFL
jgi:hypothetical protein